MISARAHVRHHYYPVGQGLFCTGEFTCTYPITQRFVWVHDCGASSSNLVSLRREVKRARAEIGPSHMIDLLILSHFDADHISGLRALLPDMTVQRVVLPYMTPADRILLAVEATDTGDMDFAEFLYDPPGFLARLAGDGAIRTVIYIGGPDESPETAAGDFDTPPFIPDPERESTQREMKIDFDDRLTDGTDQPYTSKGVRYPHVQHATRSTRLFVGAWWEFLFYNKAPWRGNLPILRKQVTELLAEVDNERLDLADAVTRIRNLYRSSTQFGASARGCNDISLLTYGGPVRPQGYDLRVSNHRAALWPAFLDNIRSAWTVPGHFRRPHKPAGLLYTGDISLNSAARRSAQLRWGAARWRRIGFVQMPHHGADSAWQEADATQWWHRHSVFSYGTTNTYGHPSPRVVTAMNRHGPLLVNEHQGVTWWCDLEWQFLGRPDTPYIDET